MVATVMENIPIVFGGEKKNNCTDLVEIVQIVDSEVIVSKNVDLSTPIGEIEAFRVTRTLTLRRGSSMKSLGTWILTG